MTASEQFELHPRLAADCAVVGEMTVSRLLLMHDRRFPWCILVPMRPGLRELHHLPADDRLPLLSEIDAVSRALLDRFTVSKINVGALGNLVPQLHVHVVGRTLEDAAWPGPVWGAGTAQPYPPEELANRLRQLRDALGLHSD